VCFLLFLAIKARFFEQKTRFKKFEGNHLQSTRLQFLPTVNKGVSRRPDGRCPRKNTGF
jgi:hypothetical protein